VHGNGLVDLAESFDQLTSELVVIFVFVGKAVITSCCRGGSTVDCRERLLPWSSHTWPVFGREQPVRDTGILERGKVSVKFWRSFTGKKSLGVLLIKCWIGSPLHFIHELVEVAPLESHQRTQTIAKVGVHIDVGAHVVGERA
jgi:hypothetical protein